MNDCAPKTGRSASLQQASLALRHAQRAFAAMLDAVSFGTARAGGEFRNAQLRSAARRTLSALSADDRAELTEWLTLQVAAGMSGSRDQVLDIVLHIDLRLVARVRRTLADRVEALAMRGGRSQIVAT